MPGTLCSTLGRLIKPQHRYTDSGAPDRMLGRTHDAQADALRSPVGVEGVDVRFGTDRITGSALLRDERVVHVEVHRVV